RCREVLESLEKERASFGVRDRGAWIVTDRRDVGLDLRKVRIDRPVERQVVRDAPADIAADLRPLPRVVPSTVGRLRAVAARDHFRDDVDDDPATQVPEADQPPRLAEEGRTGATGRHPAVFLTRVLYLPDDVNSPVLHVFRLVAQALERNANLDLIPVV